MRNYPNQTQYTFCVGPVSYGNKIVLDAHSFSIPIHKWTILMGKSGQGKTTFLKTLLKLIPGLQSYPDHISTAYMPQRDLLLPWKKVIDNVTLGSSLRSYRSDHRKAENLLRSVGLESQAHCYPHDLSVGMRQRVNLARTLMEDADLILMDEPFTAVDHQTKEQLHTLAKTHLKGKTVLMVTHDKNEAKKLGDFIFELKGKPAVSLPLL